MELEERFCEFYDLKPRRINDTQILDILEMLIRHFDQVNFVDTDRFNCNYSIMSEIQSSLKRKEHDFPFNGYGWNIRDVILSQCIDEEAKQNSDFRDELRYYLMTGWERFLQIFRFGR